MDFICKITLLISCLAIVQTLLSLLAPDKYRREIRAILSLSAVIALAAAASNADFSGISSDFSDIRITENGFNSDDLIKKELEGKIADYIGSFLEEEGIICKKIEVISTIDADRRISITEASLELDEKYRERLPYITTLIEEKIGKIKIDICCGDG